MRLCVNLSRPSMWTKPETRSLLRSRILGGTWRFKTAGFGVWDFGVVQVFRGFGGVRV